jgi:hypothetical protein
MTKIKLQLYANQEITFSTNFNKEYEKETKRGEINDVNFF